MHTSRASVHIPRMKKIILVIVLMIIDRVISDPQTQQLLNQCSNFDISEDLSIFLSNVNKTFEDIREQLTKVHFATAYQTDVFGMAQCRNYLSAIDCIACFDAGLIQIRHDCRPSAVGARLIYQGCFLRYGVQNFYKQVISDNSNGKCGTSRSVSEATSFNPVVQSLLTDLAAATPQIKSFFAAAKRQVFDGGLTATATVYGVAQCIETISDSDCQNCLTRAYTNIQTCPPQAEGSSVDAGCFLRYSDTSFFSDSDITNIAPYIEGGTSSIKTTITTVVGGGLGLIVLILALLLRYRFFRKGNVAERGDILGLTKFQGPIMYSYKDLKSATNSFSEEYKIGEGGFADVYKGVIKNGDIVAVKKLAITSSKAKADFESEVRLISNVHHRNIIRLLGCSGRRSELLLVFEYMANGSLDKFLYGEKRGTLNWSHRLDIIFGIARGIAYLHEQFHLCIIHRDIKSSNILLDDVFRAKIADFGLARVIREDQSHITTRYAGTVGYTAPEYAMHGQLSEKVDIYSFGVVVLEIISGLRCSGLRIEPVNGSLLEYAWKLYEDDMHLDLIDKELDPDEYKIEYVKNIIELALMCTQSPASLRPTMSEVVVFLTTDASLQQQPPTRSTMA